MKIKQNGEVLRGEFVGCVEKIEAWHTRAYVSEIFSSSRKIARKTSRKDKE